MVIVYGRQVHEGKPHGLQPVGVRLNVAYLHAPAFPRSLVVWGITGDRAETPLSPYRTYLNREVKQVMPFTGTGIA